MKPSLPQKDGLEERIERAAVLALQQRVYGYKAIEGLPMPLASNEGVIEEAASLLYGSHWFKGQIENQLSIFVNLKIWELLSQFQADKTSIDEYIQQTAEIANAARGTMLTGKINQKDDAHSLISSLADHIRGTDVTDSQEFANLASYSKAFTLYETPNITGLWQDDKTFASQRLAGLNPMAIRRVTIHGKVGTSWDSLKPKLSPVITDVTVQYFLGPQSSFARAIEECRLFVCDYVALKQAKAADDAPGAQKGQFLMGPIALYVRTDDFPGLQLAAIQIDQSRNVDGNNDYPAMMAADATKAGNANRWIMAKMFVQAADLNFNQAVNHLGETHLIEEAFALATRRQLAPQHPVNILLSHHFRALLVINKLGELTLLNKEGLVQKILEGGLKGALTLIQDAYDTWTFESLDFPCRILARGLDFNSSSLKYFPYRDDGELIWNTLHDYVNEYLGLYYKSDQDVQEDYELQAWAKEIASGDYGHIKGFNSQIKSLKEFCTIVQRLIWTAGPQHAAVNFPQIDYAAFIPNLPGATYAPPPANFTTVPVEAGDLLALLPPAVQTGIQMKTTYALAGFQFDKLLDYYSSLDCEPGNVCKKFFDELNGRVAETIRKRNKDREATQGLLPYRFLLPANIPNSTSV